MAKYIGLMTTDMRGKIGGQVASKNRYGTYFRARVAPIQPRTSYQENARSLFTATSQAWRALPSAALAAFNQVAASFNRSNSLGQKSALTGAQLFNKLSINLYLVSASNGIGSASAVAPVAVDPVTITAATASNAAGTQTFTITTDPATIPADSAAFVYATGQASPGRRFFGPKAYRLLTVIASGTLGPTHNILGAYAARFGDLAPGQVISLKVLPVDTLTGYEGTPSALLVTVAS